MPIYVHRNSQQLGPYTSAEVKSQLASGALSVHDHVWWPGEKGWVPLGESSLLKGGFQEIPGPVRVKPAPQSDPTTTRVLAIGALAANLACAVGSLAAIVLGHMALAAMKKDPNLKGRGVATAGLIIGYIMTLLYVAIFAFYFLLVPESDQEESFRTEIPLPHPPTNSAPPTPSQPVAATNPAPAGIPSVPTTNSASQAIHPAPIPATITSPDLSATNAPATTNIPDPNAVVPATNSPDSSATNAPPSTNAPDSSTNAAPMSP